MNIDRFSNGHIFIFQPIYRIIFSRDDVWETMAIGPKPKWNSLESKLAPHKCITIRGLWHLVTHSPLGTGNVCMSKSIFHRHSIERPPHLCHTFFVSSCFASCEHFDSFSMILPGPPSPIHMYNFSYYKGKRFNFEFYMVIIFYKKIFYSHFHF